MSEPRCSKKTGGNSFLFSVNSGPLRVSENHLLPVWIVLVIRRNNATLPLKPVNEETYKIIGRKGKEGVSFLYERYGKRLYSYAVFNWKLTEDESWDIVYKTLYKIIETTDRYEFESEKKFASFVLKVFINYLRHYYRDTKKVKEHLEVTSIEETFLPPGTLESKEESKETNSEKMILLKQELELLEDWERMLLLLRSQNMPYSEIAKFVNKPEDHLKVYYQRLKTSLTKRINDKLNAK